MEKTIYSGQPHQVLILCSGLLCLEGRTVDLNYSINDSIIYPLLTGSVKPTLSRTKYYSKFKYEKDSQ